FFFFQAEDGIRDRNVTGVQTCALPILRETGRSIVVSETRKGLNGIEIKFLALDNFLQREIETDGALVDYGRFRTLAKQLLQARGEAGYFVPGDRFSGPDQLAGVARVDIHTKHAHPL